METNIMNKDTKILQEYLQNIDIKPYYVDIGCSDMFNVPYSNIVNSQHTLFIEGDYKKCSYYNKEQFYIDNFKLINAFATPDNVLELLQDLKHIGFLDLDIDGYDYFVLQKILTKYQPDLLCCEINEKIPWPIKFTVLYDKNYKWDVSHFYGMSLAKLDELVCSNYNLINLTGNNAYYVHKRIKHDYKNIDSAHAYKNYYNSTDFPWNKNVDYWRDLDTQQAIKSINTFFNKYTGLYEIDSLK